MKNKNMFWGSLLILTAIFILLDSFGYFNNIGIIKIAFTALLIGLTIKGIVKINFSMILFPLAFICILYASELNITDLTPWPILIIALLLSIGLSLIFNKPHSMVKFHHFEKDERIINEADNSNIDCSVTFGSVVKYINTNDFRSATIDCSFGAAKVYFDNAVITEDSANIYLDVSFGGVELYVPQNWNIVQGVNCTCGGIEEKNNRKVENGPIVNLYGELSFSGVTIYYV